MPDRDLLEFWAKSDTRLAIVGSPEALRVAGFNRMKPGSMQMSMHGEKAVLVICHSDPAARMARLKAGGPADPDGIW